MKTTDIELINRILADDDTAFTELVEKYQKPVHALAWRKIGDFHIAEDITQDVFLIVHQRLHTLKNPSLFAGWLYVITTHLCATWLRKKRIQTEPLEDTEITIPQKDAYSHHVAEERANTAGQAQRDVVKKLLAKLKESERTIITLHYFGDMSSREIGAFLGVSANTIRSRLRRAQQRLKKDETMIREALEHFQITPNLTDDIMREVANLKPNTPTAGKPLAPWVIAATSAVLIVLLIGLGSPHLLSFQKPYNLDAQAKTTVELVDAPIVLNIETKSDVQNQFGNENVFGKSENNDQQVDENLFAAAEAEGEDVYIPKQQWIQSEPIKGSLVDSIHITPEGELYAIGTEEFTLYSLSADEKEWQHVSDLASIAPVWTPGPPIAKWNNTLYILPSNQLFASKDDGKTWNSVHLWQEEYSPRKILLSEDAFYVGFNTNIYRSVDRGETWQVVTDGSMGLIHFLVKSQNTLIIGADKGLFRINDDKWEHIALPEQKIGRLLSVTSTNKNIYFAAEFNWERPDRVFAGQENGWWIFRSTDLGESWKDITPTNAWNIHDLLPEIALVAFDETLLAFADGMVRSTDAGETWMPLHVPGTSSSKISQCRSVAVNRQNLYIGSEDGLHHSTDHGKTWEKVNILQERVMSPIDTLIAYKGGDKNQNTQSTLYARFGGKTWSLTGQIAKTTDKGKSWKTIQKEIPITTPFRGGQPKIIQIIKYGDNVYAMHGIFGESDSLLYRLSENGNKLIPMQDVPSFDKGLLFNYYLININRSNTIEYKKHVEENSFGATQFFKQLQQLNTLPNKNVADRQKRDLFSLGFRGPFAVSGDTFYMEYNFKLFRWKRGETKWRDTGLEETIELTVDIARIESKLAVSGNTVYVGKRDGHLVVSYDRGNSWTDLTQGLPFQVKTFKDIIVAETTVFVATDGGIITTDDGRTWRTITDADGNNLIMEHLAVDGTTLYGVTKDTGIYRIESGTWKKFVSNIPDSVTSLAVDGNTLYVGTEYNEVLHYNLEQ